MFLTHCVWDGALSISIKGEQVRPGGTRNMANRGHVVLMLVHYLL